MKFRHLSLLVFVFSLGLLMPDQAFSDEDTYDDPYAEFVYADELRIYRQPAVKSHKLSLDKEDEKKLKKKKALKRRGKKAKKTKKGKKRSKTSAKRKPKTTIAGAGYFPKVYAPDQLENSVSVGRGQISFETEKWQLRRDRKRD